MREKKPRYPRIEPFTSGRDAVQLEPRSLRGFILPSYLAEERTDGTWYIGLPTGASSPPQWAGPFTSVEDACAYVTAQFVAHIKERRRNMLGEDAGKRQQRTAPASTRVGNSTGKAAPRKRSPGRKRK